MRFVFLILLTFAFCAAPAFAQDPPHQHPTSDAWQWGVEGNVFAGYNYQYRKFTDFDEFESQNWLMTSLSKTFGGSSNLEFVGMFSLEPFTLRDIGSPQVFQTGETFDGAPLIDYQHPHDLIMNLGAEFSHVFGATQRDDCRPMPSAPRRSGRRCSCTGRPRSRIRRRRSRITISIRRTSRRASFPSAWSDPDSVSKRARFTARSRMRIDSISTLPRSTPTASARRGRTGRGTFRFPAPISKTPERKSPYDADASHGVGLIFRGDENRSIAWLAAFGQNREVFGNLEAYLFEATKRIRRQCVLHAHRERRERHPRCRFPSDRRRAYASAIADRRADARLQPRCRRAIVRQVRDRRRCHGLSGARQPQGVVRLAVVVPHLSEISGARRRSTQPRSLTTAENSRTINCHAPHLGR